MALLPCIIFFFSGAAGVLFESLWFRLMGLTLGNSVWASSIVLARFMAGLAAGNASAARNGQRLRRPLENSIQAGLVRGRWDGWSEGDGRTWMG
jgi:spermidine synthase